MFKAGIYQARIYGAGIYTGNGTGVDQYVFIPDLKRDFRKGMIKTEIRMGRETLSRSAEKVSSGRMTKVRR